METEADIRAAASAPGPIRLTYESGVSRERLPDGSLRITVVTGRSQALVVITACAGIAVLAAAAAYLFGVSFVPPRWAYLGFAALPLCLVGLVLTLLTPKRQRHAVEVGPAGLRVQTTVSGDRVDRFHPRPEILSVRAVGASIQIRTTRDFYQSITFGNRKVLAAMAVTINKELNDRPDDHPMGPDR